jgi:hypothetical protein
MSEIFVIYLRSESLPRGGQGGGEMATIDELIEYFKKNMEMGYQATLLFNGQDTVTLSCDPKTDGYVGLTVVNKPEHEFPHRKKASDK